MLCTSFCFCIQSSHSGGAASRCGPWQVLCERTWTTWWGPAAMVLAEYRAFGVAHLDMSTSQSKCTQMIPNVFISIQGWHAATPILTFDCLQEFCGPEVLGTRQKADLVASFNVLISPPRGKWGAVPFGLRTTDYHCTSSWGTKKQGRSLAWVARYGKILWQDPTCFYIFYNTVWIVVSFSWGLSLHTHGVKRGGRRQYRFVHPEKRPDPGRHTPCLLHSFMVWL